METIKTIFIEVAHNTKSVSDLIKALKALTDKKEGGKTRDDEKYAYQAFCCALLAKQANNIMQKRQYIQEYNIFIQKSLLLDSDCIMGRLIRLMVEKQLQNVDFVSHINVDTQFLSEKATALNDEELIELINIILSK